MRYEDSSEDEEISPGGSAAGGADLIGVAMLPWSSFIVEEKPSHCIWRERTAGGRSVYHGRWSTS